MIKGCRKDATSSAMNCMLVNMCRSCSATDRALTGQSYDILNERWISHIEQIRSCFPDLDFTAGDTFLLCAACIKTLTVVVDMKNNLIISDYNYGRYLEQVLPVGGRNKLGNITIPLEQYEKETIEVITVRDDVGDASSVTATDDTFVRCDDADCNDPLADDSFPHDEPDVYPCKTNDIMIDSTVSFDLLDKCRRLVTNPLVVVMDDDNEKRDDDEKSDVQTDEPTTTSKPMNVERTISMQNYEQYLRVEVLTAPTVVDSKKRRFVNGRNLVLYLCKTCDDKFETKTTLRKHQKSCRSNTDLTLLYPCKYCHVEFDSVQGRFDHEKCHRYGSFIKCSYCTVRFKSFQNYRVHFNWHQRTHPYRCTICRSLFRKETALSKHVAELHREDDVESKRIVA